MSASRLKTFVISASAAAGLAGVGTVAVSQPGVAPPPVAPTPFDPADPLSGWPARTTATPDLDPRTNGDVKAVCPRLFGVAAPPAPADDTATRLRKARLSVAASSVRRVLGRTELRPFDEADLRDLVEACERVGPAAAEVVSDPAELRAWRREVVAVAKFAERMTVVGVQAGRLGPGALVTARHARLSAELDFVRPGGDAPRGD